MLIRLAIPSDDDAIIAMGRANCEETCAGDEYSERRARELLAAYRDGSNPTFFVAEGPGRQLVGFLMARWMNYDHRDGFYTAQSVLYVLPAKRGTRAAAALMKHFVAWSERIGASSILGGNDNSFRSERTARFLEHFGLEKVGIMMRKRL